ncbi:MAG TPA: hypothetical protein VGL11_23435 [Candidatus Binatia bacterium]
MASFEFRPEIFLPGYIGYEDELRMRLLRLARVAAFALPVLSLLFAGLASRANPQSGAVRWGGIGMLCGTVGMPVVLAAAGFTRVELRALLPLPADAIFFGALSGLWLSRRWAQRLETWGWFLIVLSMGAGLFMGLYAFDAPLLPADLIGAYNDPVRRSIRLAHVACILLGFSTIFISRTVEKIGWKL